MSVAEQTRPLRQTVGSPRSRRFRWLPTVFLVLSDFLAVNLAFYAAWHLRYVWRFGGDVEAFDQVSYEVYQPLALALSVLVLATFLVGSLYREHQAAFWLTDLLAIYGRCGFAVMTLFAASTMIRYPASSRLTFVYVWVLATVFIALGRLVVQGLTGALYRHGVGSERVLIVGDNSLGRMVMQSIAAQPHLGYQVVGFLGEARADDFGRFRLLGPVDHIEQACAELAIDQVIVALPSASHELQLRIVEHCRRAGVGFKLVPDLFEMSLRRIDLDTVSGVPLIGLKEVSIEGTDLLLKRLLDVMLTLLVLVPGSLVMLAVALWVRLDSPGPVIFRQTRVGKHGRHFTLFKFRSMRDGAEEVERDPNEHRAVLYKNRRDSRVTRAGRWIRRASLDELPQLVNVLRGDMSLVGPRPGLPSEVERYEAWQQKRLQVAPGLTGLWQVSGRSNLDFEEMVVLDLAYIQNWSLSLDLSILLRTAPAVISGGGAF